MKKAICVLFALMMLLSCSAGCGDDMLPEYEKLLSGSWTYVGTNKFSASERDWDQFPFESVTEINYLGSHKAELTGKNGSKYDADLFISVDCAGTMIMTILNTDAYFGYQHDFCGKLYIAQDGTFLVLEINPGEYCYFSERNGQTENIDEDDSEMIDLDDLLGAHWDQPSRNA